MQGLDALTKNRYPERFCHFLAFSLLCFVPRYGKSRVAMLYINMLLKLEIR